MMGYRAVPCYTSTRSMPAVIAYSLAFFSPKTWGQLSTTC